MGGAASKNGIRGAGAKDARQLGSAAWEAHEPRKAGEPPRILFIGPEGAGKTALLDLLQTRLAARQLRNPPPSVQPRAFDAHAGGLQFTAIDQPGADRLRAWWADALREADGVVFAVDTSDAVQLRLLRTTFDGLIPLLNARKAPLLLLATKQDVQGTLSAGRLAAQLDLVAGDPPLRVPFTARGVSLLRGAAEVDAALAWVVKRALPVTAPKPGGSGSKRRGSGAAARRDEQQPRRQRQKATAQRDEGGYNVRARA